MATAVEFNFTDGKSGKVTYSPPGSYAAATGYLNCQTGQNTVTGANWRAFFSFDTASLPDNALVRQVEFQVRLAGSQPGGAPETYRLRFSIGTFIGAALNGDSGEFQAGTLMATLETKPDDETWIDLDQDGLGPQSRVNLTGDTDLKVWDDSARGSGDSSWGLNFNASKAKCKLRVTYTIPSGTATGRGLAQATGTVLVHGEGSGTGRGTAQVSGVVEVSGGARGSGRGGASLAATVVATGAGIATGMGWAEAVAMVVAAGSCVATGRGMVSCQVLVEQQGPGATATGQGLAWCRLTAVHFDPLARHSASRSVRTGSVGARSACGVHNRMASCGPKDLGLRGPRR